MKQMIFITYKHITFILSIAFYQCAICYPVDLYFSVSPKFGLRYNTVIDESKEYATAPSVGFDACIGLDRLGVNAEYLISRKHLDNWRGNYHYWGNYFLDIDIIGFYVKLINKKHYELIIKPGYGKYYTRSYVNHLVTGGSYIPAGMNPRGLFNGNLEGWKISSAFSYNINRYFSLAAEWAYYKADGITFNTIRMLNVFQLNLTI